jgi:hypothetical protein
MNTARVRALLAELTEAVDALEREHGAEPLRPKRAKPTVVPVNEPRAEAVDRVRRALRKQGIG